ncbi:hypothetical protein [Francisella sp. 19X1-34]|uniref:hypothetical protein n=1 Tax=Francisella sp. 19X1-34 TaxID=3087177 RepID=UPI002E2EFD7C|nr:hypothetical protein [Francisella sp. 19X1-34]MED7787607.1 hypothetical protein [Francisella sp. 19X1-34]
MQKIKKISLLSIVLLITLINFSNARQTGAYSLAINKPRMSNHIYSDSFSGGDIQSRLQELNRG